MLHPINIKYFSPWFFTLIISGMMMVHPQEVSFNHYSVKEGISQSEIKCIFQDSDGYIWFGTQNGLNKFDGYTFEKFFYIPADSNTISNNWIFGITEDNQGFIWVGTKGGLNRYDKKSGSFTRINHQLPASIIKDLFVYGVASFESFIYINTPPALSILNIETGELDTYDNQYGYEGILHDIGYPILRCTDGLIWIGSDHGLSFFNPKDKRFYNFTHAEDDPGSVSNNHITALFEDRAGNILVGTANGLNSYNKKTRVFRHWFHDETNPNSLSNSFIRSIWQDHSGAVWVGTEAGGLNKMTFHAQDGSVTFSHFRSLADNKYYISHDIVYSLYEDRSYNLWIGTINGIDKLDLKKKKFRHYKKSDNPGSVNLLDNVIGAIYKDDDGRLWIGNWNKGLNIYDRSTHHIEHYTSSSRDNLKIPGNNVHVIFKDSQSRIWLGTRDGVCIFDRKKHKFRLFQDYFDISITDYFIGNRVYCIIEDSAGRIWMGTGNGIFILDTRSKNTSMIQSGSPDPLTISNNLVYSLLEDRDKHIWIATSNGLNRYVPEDSTIYHYFHNEASENTLCDNYTISLCEDLKENIWIGTSSGVSRFNKADSVFTHYAMKDGLPSNIIYDIVEDNQNDLWFTTGNGLARYNPASGTIRSYTLEEGIQGMEFNIKAVFKGEDGELFFGGMDGLISFYPDSLLDNTYIPPVRITSFEKETSGIRSRKGVYDGEVNLSYRDYSFTIEFSALDFSDPSKNQYAYQLEPLSDKWINIGNRRFVHFTNLPPGKYFFRVKGTNNDGFWNPVATGITITISPPWWKSRYAYIFYFLITALAIVFIIQWRERNLIREKKTLEQKVRQRTKEIEKQKDKLDELNTTKDKFFSILAHDLKSPFSSLYSMSEVMSGNYDSMEESDKRTGMNKIHKMAELIFKLLENLLVWSRSQRGGVEYTLVRFNLSKAIEVNVNLHKAVAGQKGIILRNKVSGDLFAFGDLEMVNTVLRNLISNAVKFTASDRLVEVDVQKNGDFLEVLVNDQGVGISSENMQKLFRIDVKYKTPGTAGETGTGLGLVICREFVERNGGKIWCESQEHYGTTFHFTIPLAANNMIPKPKEL